VKKNSSSKAMSCYPRKIEVLQQLSDFERWRRSVGYGKRWMAETVFSAMKKWMFREHVVARNYKHMVKEMYLKALLYDLLASMNL
jgi:hypothetical protein